MGNYEVITTINGQVIHRLSDGAWIPMDSENRDYVQYLKDIA